jgi:hypothetical protein
MGSEVIERAPWDVDAREVVEKLMVLSAIGVGLLGIRQARHTNQNGEMSWARSTMKVT